MPQRRWINTYPLSSDAFAARREASRVGRRGRRRRQLGQRRFSTFLAGDWVKAVGAVALRGLKVGKGDVVASAPLSWSSSAPPCSNITKTAASTIN
jgi:hypothetical protein